jgi:hypothetical protein
VLRSDAPEISFQRILLCVPVVEFLARKPNASVECQLID